MTHKKPSSLKSVIEESSSVAKAVEKAWQRVGKPIEFSVKVFETEERNFLGMTKKPAKIGLFFQEAVAARLDRQETEKGQRQEQRPPRQAQRQQSQPREERAPQQRREQREHHAEPRQERQQRPAAQPSQQQQRWTDAMVSSARSWLEDTLRIMGKDAVAFKAEPNNYYLKITFDSSLFDDREKERAFYRLTSYLMMQALRTSFKEGFRGFKIIMSAHS